MQTMEALVECLVELIRVRVLMFNATFNNILAISWWSVKSVEETGVHQRKPPTCSKSLTNFIS